MFTLPTLCLTEVAPEATLADTDAFLWRSGFPELWQRPDLDRDLWLGSYVATYLERDVRQILNVGDLRDFDRFLRAEGFRKLAGEYGAGALAHARVACRGETPYPLDRAGETRAVPVGGPDGLLADVGAVFT